MIHIVSDADRTKLVDAEVSEKNAVPKEDISDLMEVDNTP